MDGRASTGKCGIPLLNLYSFINSVHRTSKRAFQVPISPYIAGVRSKIGNDLLLLPSVAIMLFDNEGRLLLAQDADSGLWMTIGGAIEPDERPADAAVRECHEETALIVELSGLLGVFGGPEFRVRYPNGDLTSYVVIAFLARQVGGTASPDGSEASALRFVSREEAKSLAMGPLAREMIKCAFEYSGQPTF
jgi:8-oxo-dGTP pyrophosphatase MutT (NUDIX family)